MAIREYVGARYVPRFRGTYDATTIYEALDVVDNGLGTSYIAKVPTPAGTPLTNTTYWAVYGATSGAIINLQNQIDNINHIIESGYVNVLTLGVKNDGSEDSSAIINSNSDKPLFFPAGKYRFDSTLNLKNNIMGEGYPHCWKPDHFSGTIFEFTMTDSSNAIEYDGNIDEQSIDFGNVLIQLSYAGTGKAISLTSTNTRICIHDIDILNVHTYGIYADPSEAASGYIDVENATIWGVYANPTIGSVGIYCGALAFDSVFKNCYIMGVQKGIELHCGNCRILGGQIWCAGGTNSATYYNATVCVDIYATGTIIEGLYFDSAHVLIHTGPIGKIVTVTNCNAYWGAYETLRTFDPPTLFAMANTATTIYVKNTYIEMPFSIFYVSNHPQNIIGSPIFNGYGDNNVFNFAHSAKCDYDSRYAWRIDTANGNYVEIARMTQYASVYANVGNWQMLITARGGGNPVEFIKIGTGLNVFYKETADGYFKIYVYLPDPYDCVMTGLTVGVLNPAYTLLNGERIALDQQNDATGLSAATEKLWINP